MKVIFMGTPLFALSSLEQIIKAKHQILAVVTQTNKPKGRGQKISLPPVKIFSDSKNIKTFQPEKLKDKELIFALSSMSPDIIVVAAYGKILPEEILKIPKFGCINVHASLLPKYRGAAPVAWSIINGERKTGVTIMQMDEGLDTGDILLQKETKILDDDTEASLKERLSIIGAKALTEVLEILERGGTLDKRVQDNNLANFAPIIKKEFSVIDWNKSASEIHNLIRGFNPWPGARTFLNGKLLKIHKSKAQNINLNEEKSVNSWHSLESAATGTILRLDPLLVKCSVGVIEILQLQLEGKRKMSYKEFLRGNNIKVLTKLGSAD
ncbi:MAG: methionyl-tRNA formyltransferase [Oscillospiraceae bacterium]|jgi:methionyl-tRNA formyltransferase|nr:methionyl-tRNA formyltransferase [Oscillospiraceae bacterium]